MLNNPQWNSKKTDSTIFSLDALIDWLRQQYAEQEYCYLSNGGCLIAQYFTDCGYEDVLVGAGEFDARGGELRVFYPEIFDEIAHPVSTANGCTPVIQTFGAALERALMSRAREKIAA